VPLWEFGAFGGVAKLKLYHFGEQKGGWINFES